MWFSKKDTATQGDTPSEQQTDGLTSLSTSTDTSPESTKHEAFSLEDTEEKPDVLFSDKPLKEVEEEIAVEQANMRRIREETHDMITEEHPEIEREDTIDKAHERGEL